MDTAITCRFKPNRRHFTRFHPVTFNMSQQPFWTFICRHASVTFNVSQFVLVTAGAVQWRRRSLATMAALLVPALVTLSLQGAYYYSLHRVIYPITDHGALSIKTGLCGGWLGLLVDRTDGLFVYWPTALIALGGLVILRRMNWKIGGWIAVLVTAHWLAVGMFPVWTGGPVAPLRYWLPVMPLLVIASTVALACVRTRIVLMIILLCMGLSIGIGFYNSEHPRRWFGNVPPLASARPRVELVLEGIWRLFPDMKKPVAVDYGKGVLWVLILAGGAMALGRQRLTRTG